MVNINIGNGQGITQAIRDKIGAGNIKNSNLETWQKVMTEVNNAQSKEKSIFKAGENNTTDVNKLADKSTWSSNFVVDEGNVEIDDGVWNKIKKLLTGKAEERVPVQEPVHTQEPVSQEPPVQSEPQNVTSSEQPQATRVNNSEIQKPRSEEITETPSGSQQHENQTVSQTDYSFLAVKDLSNKGKKVVKDGMTYQYDDEGYISRGYNKDGQKIFEASLEGYTMAARMMSKDEMLKSGEGRIIVNTYGYSNDKKLMNSEERLIDGTLVATFKYESIKPEMLDSQTVGQEGAQFYEKHRVDQNVPVGEPIAFKVVVDKNGDIIDEDIIGFKE